VQLLNAFVWDDVSLISCNRKIYLKAGVCFIAPTIPFAITEEYKTIQWYTLLPEVISNCQFKFQFGRMFSVHTIRVAA
jgi:hypothetical protein